jgi:steroid delta-isomerase-like uncharacterized protein
LSAEPLLGAWREAWSRRDPSAFAAICAPTVTYRDPLTAGPLQGPEAVAEHAARLWAGLPDLRLEAAGDALADATRVAAPLRLAGTHQGSLGELPPTGRRLAVDCVVWLESETVRVTSARTVFDLYDAAVQLGVLPTPGSVGEKALLVLRGFGLRA